MQRDHHGKTKRIMRICHLIRTCRSSEKRRFQRRMIRVSEKAFHSVCINTCESDLYPVKRNFLFADENVLHFQDRYAYIREQICQYRSRMARYLKILSMEVIMRFLILILLYWLLTKIPLEGIDTLASQLLLIAIILYGIRLALISAFPPHRRGEDRFTDWL